MGVFSNVRACTPTSLKNMKRSREVGNVAADRLLARLDARKKRQRVSAPPPAFPWPDLVDDMQCEVRKRLPLSTCILALALTCKRELALLPRWWPRHPMVGDYIAGGHWQYMPTSKYMHIAPRWLQCFFIQHAIRGRHITLARTLVRYTHHVDCDDCNTVVVQHEATWLVPDLWLIHRWKARGCRETHLDWCQTDPAFCLEPQLTTHAITLGKVGMAHWLQEHGHWRQPEYEDLSSSSDSETC
jgi:hypothetical protein